MNSDNWRSLCADIPAEATPGELEAALGDAGGGALNEDDRAALWLFVWSRSARAGRTVSRRRADACSSASPAMVRHLARLIRDNVGSPGEREHPKVRNLRRSPRVVHRDPASG